MSASPFLRIPFLLALLAVASTAFASPMPSGAPLSPGAPARCAASPRAGLAALKQQIFGSPLHGPTRVGEEVLLGVRSPEIQEVSTGRARLVWSWTIREPEASYIAPHFSHFDLPPGAVLIVRSPRGERTWRFQGTGKGTLGLTEGFWGIHIPGSVALLELWADGPVREGAVVVDQYARGFPDTAPPDESICGVDDGQWAKCIESTLPVYYEKSKAVARLMINGVGACTGWLIGNAGHLMTNNHCIGSATDAANTDYEFMAEGATCATNCASYGACPGTVAATSATLIQSDFDLDYALVQLPTNASTTYGYLQLRPTGAQLEEQIYIPGHPAAWGKRIAVQSTDPTDGSGRCEVYGLNEFPCFGGPGDIGYFCDTQGGSSGSPVIASSDHLVVALHHCGTCPNVGVPIQAIIDDLGPNLPPSSTGTPCTPPAAPVAGAAAAGPDQINIFWPAVPGVTQYGVYRSLTSGGPYTLVGTTAATSFADTGRACSTTYHYVVRSLGSCSSGFSNQATATTTPCPLCAPLTLYSSGFEIGGGLADWAAGTFGGSGSTEDWRGIQTCPAKTGSNLFRFGGPACSDDYLDNSFAFAQPGGNEGIAVPEGVISTRLSFWHRREIEYGYDGATLAVSVDGSSYTYVPSSAIISGTTYNSTTINDCPPSPSAAGVPVFTGSDFNFTQTVVDLDAACNAAAGTSCAGKSVRVGFTAITDCIVEYGGWFLDDLSISACIPLPLPSGAADFYTLPPCRLIDTRAANSSLGGPALYPGVERAFPLAGVCGIPSNARALVVNLTVVQPTGAGYVQAYAGDTGPPETAWITFRPGQIRSNNAVVALASDGTTTLKARAVSTGSVHLAIDVMGYFK